MINDENLWDLYEAMKRTDDAFGKETALKVGQVLLNNILGEPNTVAINCQEGVGLSQTVNYSGVCTAKMRKEMSEHSGVAIPRTCPTCKLGPCQQGY